MADRYRLDIDESAIYEGERRVLVLDTGNSNDGWREATALGTQIVELLNAAGVKPGRPTPEQIQAAGARDLSWAANQLAETAVCTIFAHPNLYPS